MAKRMTDDDAFTFIEAEPRTAKLATVSADGSPHVVPVWIVVDRDAEPTQIVFTVGEASYKYRSLRRDPRVALCIDDENPPFSFVEVRGTVTLHHDMDELLDFATRIGGKYMGADVAEAFGKRNAVPEEWVVRVTPTKIVGMADVAS
jgi:PPOX class probable F420-dependent enzyme